MKNDYYTLITGASKGIGRAFAEEMASRGHNLMLSSLPGEGLNEYCTALAAKYKIDVHSYETDLTSHDGPSDLFKEASEKGLQVNILINNAGAGIAGPFENYSHEEIDKIIFLNIRALTLLTFYFAPMLKKTESYILNVSSFGIYVPAAYKSVYLASKSYIYYFSRALESEYRGTGIKMSTLIPSAVRTNDQVVSRIEKAGRVARASQMEPAVIASIGIRDMFRGRKAIIPGSFTRLIFSACIFIPEGIMILLLKNLFKK